MKYKPQKMTKSSTSEWRRMSIYGKNNFWKRLKLLPTQILSEADIFFIDLLLCYGNTVCCVFHSYQHLWLN